MGKNGWRFSRVARILSAAAIVAPCVSFACVAAYAQTDQAVVMVCTNQFPGLRTFTFDLAAKTVTEIDTVAAGYQEPPEQGTITQITDQEIVLTMPKSQLQYTLNRYTGRMSIEYTNPTFTADYAASNGGRPLPGLSCQKQQKQF